MLTYLIARVRSVLRADPSATIVSVSQNDNGNYCTRVGWPRIERWTFTSRNIARACRLTEGPAFGPRSSQPADQAVIDEEGSPMGPMLRAINAVAANISTDFPHVTVSTLSYQYTRPPPRTTIPRANVRPRTEISQKAF